MKWLLAIILTLNQLAAQNQTNTLSPVLPEDSLPFTLQIEEADFSLPVGLQGYASGVYNGKWILLAGRTNGLHGFDNIGNNFPPRFQNTTVYVVDPQTGETLSRSLQESGLSQKIIDDLSTVASEFFQKGSTLYLVGGYGIETENGTMGTKSTLSAIDLSQLIKWVKHEKATLTETIRQISHPLLQVTGGFLFQNSDQDPFLLMLGQNFTGLYTDNSNGAYTKQIRSFWLFDNGVDLTFYPNVQTLTFPDYRRRDLNIVPIMRDILFPGYVVFSGVFTLDTGVWTVPIFVYPSGSSFEPDPTFAGTFKQAMNNYNCPAFGLYSQNNNDMYVIFPGGISYGYFSNGVFETDSEIPFINQVTTIKINNQNQYSQYLMNAQYPFIASTGTNPGNQLLFGAEAQFFAAAGLSEFPNGVIKYDDLKGETIIGYIVGGIMSTLPNTNTREDSTSSPYVFKVKWVPKQ